MKVKKRLGKRVSIKWRLLLYFAGFAAVMLGALWLLQIVFLDQFYKGIKIAEIRSASETVSKKVFSSDIGDVLEDLVEGNQICAMVLTTDVHLVASADTLPDCLIHRMSGRDIFILYSLAAENNGSFLAQFGNGKENGAYFMGKPRYYEERESIVSVRLVDDGKGDERILLLNSTVSPVSATVRTLRVQLLFVTGAMLILALVLAYLLSRKVAKPVIDISRAASGLSHGSYTPYEGGGYREVMELDETLLKASEDLARVEQLRRELLANISHDLRTPLTMITGYAEVMRDLPGENTPENVQIIIDEANHLTELVNDLLDLSKLQSGVVSLSPTVFSLTELTRSTLARYQKLTEKNGYDLSFESDGEVLIQADRTRLSQVIYNLINNAIHYTGKSKVIHLRQSCADGWVKLEVIDNGEGIPEDQLPLVWERYYKLDKVHRRSAVGTGLGLSIVQSVLELHHARYGVESRVGEGSDFWFALPIAKQEISDEDHITQKN